ncbi:MAG: ROK family protein [Planctomycetes bacterium]|nr:ROK family protein [Planctomycetota bacterium]
MHPRPRETKLAVKKNRILNEVFRSQTCSRFDLARRLNINATMVGSYVEEFLAEGVLVEDAPASGRRGRMPVPLRPNGKYGCFLGLDFEALRARAVLCDFAGEVLHKSQIPFHADISREGVLKKIVSLAQRVANKADRPLLSVGIAAPGQVDCLAGRVLHYGLLPDFSEVPLRERFEQVIDAPVFVEDNIRALAFGELLRGSGRGSQNFICLAVRSGVGLGIVIDGKLFNGVGAMAGEVGHTVFPTSDGPQTMTNLVSAKGFVASVLRLLQSWKNTPARQSLLDQGEELSLADIVAAVESGDELLRAQLEQLGTHLGMVAANLANLFAPEKIVLSGEVPDCSPIVRQTMERAFRQHTLSQILKTAYLENGTLGTFAGALGAAWQGLARMFPEDEATLVALAKERARQAG